MFRRAIQKPIRLSLQYISDIHLEYGNRPIISADATHLAICGDIGNPFHKSYKDLLHSASNEYEKVYIVAGNHEYWQNCQVSVEDVNKQIYNVVNQFNNVYFLNRSGDNINNRFNIIGCTMWTKIKEPSPITTGDDEQIGIHNINNMHKIDYTWLKSELDTYYEYDNKNLIIVTHHAPSYKLMKPSFNKNIYQNYYDRYYNDFDNLIDKNRFIHTWLCGHTHSTNSITIADTYLGVNAVGGRNKKNAYCTQILMLDD
jgi:predicted phosphohydrolase